jgi:hypothetical protein
MARRGSEAVLQPLTSRVSAAAAAAPSSLYVLAASGAAAAAGYATVVPQRNRDGGGGGGGGGGERAMGGDGCADAMLTRPALPPRASAPSFSAAVDAVVDSEDEIEV